jgi:hypothetical protein
MKPVRWATLGLNCSLRCGLFPVNLTPNPAATRCKGRKPRSASAIIPGFVMENSLARRKFIVVCFALGVGALHFVTGPGYHGPFRVFVNSYLIDILLPTAMFLLLGVSQIPGLNTAVRRGLIVFAVGAGTETLQWTGVEIFGRIFDPLDYLMYASGILLGWILERTALSRLDKP